ncbi:MAG: hypothetical protein EOP58_09990 [Sphingomonadales bacterium]|nr:MAG: hypothetical protein EOP58_09990 [Sphingomonadales bacterium]
MTGSFTRGCGVALILAALLTLGLNVFLTPMLPDAPFGMVAASARKGTGHLCYLLLLLGRDIAEGGLPRGCGYLPVGA